MHAATDDQPPEIKLGTRAEIRETAAKIAAYHQRRAIDDDGFRAPDPTDERLRAILDKTESESEDETITEEDYPVPPDPTDTDYILTRTGGIAPGPIPIPVLEALTRRALQYPKSKNAPRTIILMRVGTSKKE